MLIRNLFKLCFYTKMYVIKKPVRHSSSFESISSEHNSSKQKQTQKKSHTIKIQVSKLLRPVASRTISSKPIINPSLKTQLTENQNYTQNASLSEQMQSEKPKKVIRTFEQMYLEKLKQVKTKQQNFISSFSDNTCPNFGLEMVKKQQPLSCKNLSTRTNDKRLVKNPLLSVKNKIEKQNIFHQKNLSSSLQKRSLLQTKSPGIQKYFKKVTLKTNNANLVKDQNETKNVDFKGSKQQQKQTQLKLKKVLKINKHTQQLDCDQTLKKVQNTKNNSANFIQAQKKQILVQDMSDSPRIQIKRINPSTSQSPINQENQASLESHALEGHSLESQINQIFRSKIDHHKHEHIWGGIECFVSKKEFFLILENIGFQSNQNSKQTAFYVNKIWESLGGNTYGGVVKHNIIHFLKIALQQNGETPEKQNYHINKKDAMPLQNYVDKSTLKLVNLTKINQLQIKKFYFPLRMSKLAMRTHQQFLKKDETQNHLAQNHLTKYHFKSSHLSCNSKENQSLGLKNLLKTQFYQNQQLQNKICLNNLSEKNQSNQKISPLRQHTYLENNGQFVTDFSPKLSSQQYEPFCSTVLKKQEDTSIQQFQKNYQEIKVPRKPLLSVDVNLGEGNSQKLIVYEGQTPYQVSLELKEKYNIEEQLRQKFQKMLQSHLRSLLFKIQQVSEELFEDSQQLLNEENDFVMMERQ